MTYIQFFLTVNDGKWLIAQAISRMEAVRHAFQYGKLALKGGTTVSCLSEILDPEQKLRICGRMTPRGAVSAKKDTNAPHTLLWSEGRAVNLDGTVDDALLELGPEDILVTGANLIDSAGGAAMLAGSPGGNRCGKAVSAMTAEGFQVIIAAGLEKLIPGSVQDAIRAARRKGIDAAMGMACGLFPVYGELVTELTAIRMLAGVQAEVIGRGGIFGAEGGTLFQAWGEAGELQKLADAVKWCRGRPIAGEPESLSECSHPSPGCGYHLSCAYCKKNREHEVGLL
ncbi:hypothetical protein DWV16_16385 [Anaerotruncus sp. AF02-27]|jgi:hypothetical protein|uniref:hypothetical protein n=1 Tax=Anaerotruncus TaxID=244127 RepID=UPI000E4950C2|nr:MULTISPECIES: hypothetical protein [Anaerotruncus]RGX53602.1 hypothetical protein DWV16_16385 [Anaerotruncus sp. AF02-27]